MIKTIEVQLYGHPGNNAVVKMPNRQNPGIVVQADTLLQMARDARGLSEKLQVGSTRKIVASEANALAERLEQMFEHLKAQVNAIGEQITLWRRRAAEPATAQNQDPTQSQNGVMPAGDCNPECPPITFNDGTSSTPQDQVDSSLTQNYNGTTLGQFSLLNPRFYLEGLITKPLAWLAIRGLNLLGLSPAAVNGILGIAGVAAIPLYEVGTAVGAMNDFFYGGFGVPGAVDNLPVNLPGPYGSGVPMGGGVYWQEEYPYWE